MNSSPAWDKNTYFEIQGIGEISICSLLGFFWQASFLKQWRVEDSEAHPFLPTPDLDPPQRTALRILSYPDPCLYSNSHLNRLETHAE